MLAFLTSCPPASPSERQCIEDGVLCRLAVLDANVGGFVRHLGAYNGDDAADAEQDMYRHLATRGPAILVTTGASQAKHRSNRATDDEDSIAVEILVVSTHWRDPVDRVRARAAANSESPLADPGVYHMMYAVRQLLMGRRCGPEGAGVLRFVGETPLILERGLCAWRSIYRVGVHIEVPLDEVERDDWNDLQLQGFVLT